MANYNCTCQGPGTVAGATGNNGCNCCAGDVLGTTDYNNNGRNCCNHNNNDVAGIFDTDSLSDFLIILAIVFLIIALCFNWD